MNDFDPKRYTEMELFRVDYSARLAPGVTIASATWSITPVNGQDAASASMIVGAAAINGALVDQMITGGVPGIRYAPVCHATTNDGQVLVEPKYGQGLLEITL
jgi:hypothetical protein